MYRNIGKKIMGLAQVLGWIFLGAGLIAWIIYLNDGYAATNSIGWIALASGGLLFISSWFLYGFGKMVDDVGKVVEEVQEIRNTLRDTKKRSGSDELPNL